MDGHQRHFVRLLLTLLALATCHGCGGGGGGGATSMAEAPAQATPAPPASASGNGAPTISKITDGYARVGSSYVFMPSASDPDGDDLRFSASNLPPWASLDSATGRISGTPRADDVGIHESISVTVADAAHSVVTTPFSITVLAESEAAPAGVASLSWERPPCKVDGSPLDDLAGYRILYGRDSSDLDESVLIDDPATTSFEIASLEPGIWYFAVVAVNASGLEGPATTVAPKSI